MICSVLVLLLLLPCTGARSATAQHHTKAGYDLWAKEKIRFLRQKVARDPYSSRARVLLANALFADGHRAEARKQLEEALRLQPDLAEAHCNLAVILHRQKQEDLARKHYEEALRLDSTMVEAVAGLGALLCTMGEAGAGLSCLEEAVARDPGRLSARYNAAVAYHKAGDFRRATAHLEKLLEADPHYPGGRLAMARACYGQGLQLLEVEHPKAALTALNRALEYETGDENMFFAKGLAHMSLDQMAEAEAALRRAVNLQGDYVPAVHNLGVVYERLGRVQEALECYQRVRELSPDLATLAAVKGASFDVTYLLR